MNKQVGHTSICFCGHTGDGPKSQHDTLDAYHPVAKFKIPIFGRGKCTVSDCKCELFVFKEIDLDNVKNNSEELSSLVNTEYKLTISETENIPCAICGKFSLIHYNRSATVHALSDFAVGQNKLHPVAGEVKKASACEVCIVQIILAMNALPHFQKRFLFDLIGSCSDRYEEGFPEDTSIPALKKDIKTYTEYVSQQLKEDALTDDLENDVDHLLAYWIDLLSALQKKNDKRE